MRVVEDVNVHYQVNTLIVVCQENRILAIKNERTTDTTNTTDEPQNDYVK